MSDKPFPYQVKPVGQEEVQLTLPNGTEVLLCAHGARTLSHMLLAAAEKQHCDGARHGDLSTMHLGSRGPDDPPFRTTPAIVYTTTKVKPYAELRPSDVPMGVDPDDLATDLG